VLADPGPHGAGGSERTYVEVWRVGDLLAGTGVDWTTIGTIMQAVKPG
jgi:hypothetical protein